MRFIDIEKNQGFTLIEILMVLAIISILAALGAPSFLGRNSKSQVDQGAAKLETALQEAQRAAMAKSKYCQVIFPSMTLPGPGVSNPTIQEATSGCIVTGSPTLKDLNIRANVQTSASSTTSFVNSVPSIIFNYQGQPVTVNGTVITPTAGSSTLITIVVSKPGYTNYQKCIVMTNYLGMIRSGVYSTSDTTQASPSNCTITQ